MHTNYFAESGVGLGIGLCCVPSADGYPGIYIHTLSPGSVAHMDGRLRCGDEIMEINDVVVYNMALNDVYTVLSQCTPGPVHITISRHPDPKVSEQQLNAAIAQAVENSKLRKDKSQWSIDNLRKESCSYRRQRCERCTDRSLSHVTARRPQRTMTRSCSDNTTCRDYTRCLALHNLHNPHHHQHHNQSAARVHSLDTPTVTSPVNSMSDTWSDNRLSVPVYPNEDYNIPYNCPTAIKTSPLVLDLGFRGNKQEEEETREETEAKDLSCTDSYSKDRHLSGDSSSAFFSPTKRTALRRQGRIEKHTPEPLQDPWVRLSTTPLKRDPAPGQHQPPPRDSIKPTTMNEEETPLDVNGNATDNENKPETNPESKKGPPVAPKPAWFRQSLRKIREEQTQTKPSKAIIDQTSTVGFSRSFGAKNAASNNLSIRQKINSFETFSGPESPEKFIGRRSVASSNSLPLTEKETSQTTKSKRRDEAKDDNANESVSALSAVTTKTNTSSPYSSESVDTSPEDEPQSLFTPTNQETNDSCSTHDNTNETPGPMSPMCTERTEDLSSFDESPVRPSANAEESPHPESDGDQEERQEKALNTSSVENSSIKGLEGESLGKILAFSNQVSHALMRSLPLPHSHGNPGSLHPQDSPDSEEPASESTERQESDPGLNSDQSFSVSLAKLRECSMKQGEGDSSGAQSVLSVIPEQEIHMMIQEVQALDEEALKQLEDIHVVILHKEEGAGLGFTIAGGSDLENKAPTVHRVFPSGLAAQEGTIQKGDQVLSINGQTLSGVTHSDATAALRQARTLTLAVVVVCKPSEEQDREGGVCSEEASASVEQEGGQFTVKLEKVSGVGFTLEGGKGSIHGDKPLIINRIFTGGSAEQGGLQSGDEVLFVQDVCLQDMTRFEAWNMIKALPEGVVTVTVRRRPDGTQ